MRTLAALATFAALGACSAEPSSPDAGSGLDAGTVDAGSWADAGPLDPEAVVGAFNVVLVAPEPAQGNTPARDGYTAFAGRVSDGPTPSQIVWEERSAEGGCRLLTPRVPFCNTPCGGSAACVEDDTCQRYPSARSVGAVRLSGVASTAGSVDIAVSPIAGNYQTPGSVTLLYPPFAEGDAVGITAEGAAAGAFTLAARGIAPLVVTSTTIRLVRGQPLTLRWRAAGLPDVSSIRIKLDISHHGGTKGMVTCEVEDDGELVLSAALMTALQDLGVAGFPTVVIGRHSTGVTSTALGRVELGVSQEIERAIELPGLRSCTEDSECTGGQTCQPDLTCG